SRPRRHETRRRIRSTVSRRGERFHDTRRSGRPQGGPPSARNTTLLFAPPLATLLTRNTSPESRRAPPLTFTRHSGSGIAKPAVGHRFSGVLDEVRPKPSTSPYARARRGPAASADSSSRPNPPSPSTNPL